MQHIIFLRYMDELRALRSTYHSEVCADWISFTYTAHIYIYFVCIYNINDILYNHIFMDWEFFSTDDPGWIRVSPVTDNTMQNMTLKEFTTPEDLDTAPGRGWSWLPQVHIYIYTVQLRLGRNAT